MKEQLVCVTGLPGAGKSIASDFFVEKKGYQYIRFGQVVVDEVMKMGLPINEANERKVREELREKHGMAAMAILNLDKVKSLMKLGSVIGDGLYSFEEYKVFKNEFGEKFIVVAIYAPPWLRHKWLGVRPLLPGDTTAKNRPLTKEEAESRDLAELQNLNKGATIAMADFTIRNIKNLEYYYEQLEETCKEIENR